MIFDKGKIYIAFYKGHDKLLDKVISWTSRGLYSHVEIIICNESFSSSGRDGGTRRKLIENMSYDDPNKWDIFELKVDNVDGFKSRWNVFRNMKSFGGFPLEKHEKNLVNGKYDYYSVVLYHVLRLGFLPKIKKNTFMCSEMVLEIIQAGLSITINPKVKSNRDRLVRKAFNEGHKATPSNVLELLLSLDLIERKIPSEEVSKND